MMEIIIIRTTTNASSLHLLLSVRNMAYQHTREDEQSACLIGQSPPEQRAVCWNSMRWRV